MEKELRILMLEDVAEDAELVQRELLKGGIVFQARVVDNRESFQKECADFSPDLILADYTLPSFDGLSALAIAQEMLPEVPFIFVSGTIGEELAVETFRGGAIDYVLKGRLSRLVPAVKRAVKEAEERAERKRTEAELHESQERYRKLVETMNEGLGVQDEEGKITYINNRFSELLGYTRDEIIGRSVSDFLDEENREIFRTEMAKRRRGEKGPYEIAWETKGGGKIYTYLSPEPIFDSSGRFKGSFAVLTDISEIRRTREELKKRVKELEDFYDMAVGRELRMIELKDEIKRLKKELERKKEGN